MSSQAIRIVLALLLPTVSFLTGGWALQHLSRRHLVRDALEEAVGQGKLDRKDARFLNLRPSGYGVEAVARHWRVLRGDVELRKAERKFLELDLFFPFVYGAGFLGGLWLLWLGLGRPFAAGWLVAPIAIGVLADWIGNSVQLHQLDRFLGGEALHGGLILVSSVATILKLLSVAGAGLFVVALAALIAGVFRPWW